jgi:CheY-like chemotaxis protein
MVSSEDTNVVIDRLQALVLASPEIAGPVTEALRELAAVNCTVPAAPLEDGSKLSWLCSVLFHGQTTEPDLPPDRDVSLFAWNRFDVVIIQDLWLAERARAASRLEFAGRVFAAWDNDRGNFSTKKIVLVTDPSLFRGRVAESDPQISGQMSLSDVQQVFDPKNAVGFVSLCGSSASAIACLLRMVSGRGSSRKSDAGTCKTTGEHPLANPSALVRVRSAIRRSVSSPVIEQAAPEFRRTIHPHTKIYLIEDEMVALGAAYHALTGKTLTLKSSGDEHGPINVLSLADGVSESAHTFEELLNLCKKTIQPILRSQEKHRDVLVVTDILLDIPNSTHTGIDLIKELRNSYLNQIGIVAFTGFVSPFVAMSAYLHGADYVVEKGEITGAHDTLQLSGTDRLLEALSFLCFQRRLLRQMRERCKSLIEYPLVAYQFADRTAGDQARRLERVMPRHTVSLHLQQEWQDTLYLLKRIQIESGGDGKELCEVLNEFRRKYDYA